MSEACNHHCEGCEQDCSQRDMHAALNQYSSIRKVVAVSSGKGGVGKSSVTAMLAVLMARRGYKVGILDADITGPSIPKAFGLTKKAHATDLGIMPEETHMGIKVMSINLLLENADQPVVWRGPVLSGAVTQFWTDVAWGELDVLFIDMPPGTGDVPLTVFQSLPVNGIVIVTSPQELVSMIVSKAVKMAQMMNIPVLGIVENMSYAVCPDCGKHIDIFGKSHTEETAEKYGLKVLGKIPFDAELAGLCDSGNIEEMQNSYLSEAVEKIIALKS